MTTPKTTSGGKVDKFINQGPLNPDEALVNYIASFPDQNACVDISDTLIDLSGTTCTEQLTLEHVQQRLTERRKGEGSFVCKLPFKNHIPETAIRINMAVDNHEEFFRLGRGNPDFFCREILEQKGSGLLLNEMGY
ncbi:hypothetical protein TruAng_001353 [Truncatella angustata]|nr:hypothetical protein TruAng_001353 [Truncatella angustata]